MLAIVLGLGAALGWGVSDFLGGLKSRSVPQLAVLLISQGAALVLLFANLVLMGEEPPVGRYLLFAAIAGLGELAGVAALYRGLAVGVMSVVAPVAALAPIVPLALGLLLGEFPGALQGAGLMLAVAGVVLASRPGRSPATPARRLLSSVLYGLLSALGFGIFFSAMDAASEGGIPWALFVARLTAVAVIVAAAFLRRARLAVPRRELPLLIVIGALIVAADSLYASATTVGFVSVVAVLGALHTVVTIVMARIFLREKLQPIQQLGVAACLCGVLAIAA